MAEKKAVNCGARCLTDSMPLHWRWRQHRSSPSLLGEVKRCTLCPFWDRPLLRRTNDDRKPRNTVELTATLGSVLSQSAATNGAVSASRSSDIPSGKIAEQPAKRKLPGSPTVRNVFGDSAYAACCDAQRIRYLEEITGASDIGHVPLQLP